MGQAHHASAMRLLITQEGGAEKGEMKSACAQPHHASAMQLLITEREARAGEMKTTLRESCSSRALGNIAVYDA